MKKEVKVMVCCVPYAALYSEPELMAENVDEILYGEEAEILDSSGSFYKIKTEYGYIGWTAKSNLFEKLHDANHITVTPFTDLLFEGKNYYQAPMTLPRGSRVDVGFSEKEGRYGFAVLPSKRIYYLHKNHVAPISTIDKSALSEDELRASFVETAKEYLGTQYRWGGRTHHGIDCSGLCFNAYRLNGVHIWRDADFSRCENLREIPFSEAKVGDLIFFKGHIAMYLGNNEIIHSTASKGKVVIEHFDENSPLYNIFICVGTAF